MTTGASTKTMIVKLEYKDLKRLAEVEVSMASLREVFKAYYGDAASAGSLHYTLAGDDDPLSLVDDRDVALAAVAGVEPIKIVSSDRVVAKAKAGDAAATLSLIHI